jgi:hypothetical protein
VNSGLLPPEFYALSEQVAGKATPHVLTLQSLRASLAEQGYHVDPAKTTAGAEDVLPTAGGVLVADAPPRVRSVSSISEAAILTLKRHRIVIRHATDDRVIALIEIISPGQQRRGPIRNGT